jgi:hypothetical protein
MKCPSDQVGSRQGVAMHVEVKAQVRDDGVVRTRDVLP